MGFNFPPDKHPLRYRRHNEVTLLTLLITTLFMLASRDAFILLGFPPEIVFVILLASVLGSGINIPLFSLESTYRRDIIIPLNFFGYRFAVPQFVHHRTLVAINVGGAVIPILVSIVLIAQSPLLLFHIVLPLAVSSVVINRQAQLVPGLGVTLPALFAPIASVLSCLIFLPLTGGLEFLVSAVYITASIGSLIGADLMNLPKIPSLGSPMVSVGGAGTFDGVFMGGVMAIILVVSFVIVPN